MKNNLTPAKIVEKYLPKYEDKIKEWNDRFRCGQVYAPSPTFIERYFSEALAERDRILCEKQREICADTELISFGYCVPNDVLHAPMPELKEE